MIGVRTMIGVGTGFNDWCLVSMEITPSMKKSSMILRDGLCLDRRYLDSTKHQIEEIQSMKVSR